MEIKIQRLCHQKAYMYSRKETLGLPWWRSVKNPPANAGDTGLSPGPGRSHMPRSN